MLKRELCLACHSTENYDRPANAFEILTPSNNAIVNKLPTPLIGMISDASVDTVRVEMNDDNFHLSVKKGVFSTILSLREGVNVIRLSAPEVLPTTLNLFYNPSIPENMSYRLYRSHGIVTKNDCSFCHEKSPNSFRIDSNNSQLCSKCHERQDGEQYVHGPVAVGSCTVCHDPHGSTNLSLLVEKGEDLCFQCHMAADALRHLMVQGAEDQSFLRDKGCGFCHDPHSSDRRFLLRNPG
jgi:predicted CXXCH cytochrome family protein